MTLPLRSMRSQAEKGRPVLEINFSRRFEIKVPFGGMAIGIAAAAFGYSIAVALQPTIDWKIVIVLAAALGVAIVLAIISAGIKEE